jgi:hypothetical protein
MTTTTVSFWIHHPPSRQAFAAWEPDREPDRFATSVGHNVLELAKRIEALGARVRVGEERVTRGAFLVFFLRDAYASAEALRSALRAVHEAHGRFALIRSDTPSDWRFPLRPAREFMPTQGSIREPWQRWLPPLTQRGLRPREPSRYGRIRTLALKGYKSNVPPVVRTPEWADDLAAASVGWWLDMAEGPDGAGQAWHDFRHVDAVLCAHHAHHLHDPSRKPATKLINAWAAGCVPLAERMPAYLELGRDLEDVLFLDDLRESARVIAHLNESPDVLASMQRRIVERGREFSIERTARAWLDGLSEAADAAEVPSWRHATRLLAVTEKRLAHLAHELTAAARRHWIA